MPDRHHCSNTWKSIEIRRQHHREEAGFHSLSSKCLSSVVWYLVLVSSTDQLRVLNQPPVGQHQQRPAQPLD